MAERGYFEHDSAAGSPFWQRLELTYARNSGSRWRVGENLAWGSPDLTASSVLALWLKSLPHRKNILSQAWREIGVGAVHAQSAPGTYGDRPATILTADFGMRR